MSLNLPNSIWVYAERLYIYAHDVNKFIELLQRHNIEYVNDPHPYNGNTKQSYTFMSEENYTFAEFMERVPTYKYLRLLEEILTDPEVIATKTDNWNYYGEFINAWYEKVVELLGVAKVKVTHGRLEHQEDEVSTQTSGERDFFAYSFTDPYLDYLCKELNEAHAGGLYLSVMFVNRKILEVVIIRIMEVVFSKFVNSTYTEANHLLWYDLGKNRYQNFEKLLDNLKSHAADFHEDRDLVKDFCVQIKPIKDEANAHVHRDYKVPNADYVSQWRLPDTLSLARKLFKKYCNP